MTTRLPCSRVGSRPRGIRRSGSSIFASEAMAACGPGARPSSFGPWPDYRTQATYAIGDGGGGLGRSQGAGEISGRGRGAVPSDRGNSVLAGGKGHEVGPAVGGLGEVEVAVVLVVDNVRSAEEGVA